MGIVDVTQMWSRDGGTKATDEKDFTFRAHQRTRGFQVLTDDPETSQIDVENAAGLPILGELYPGSTYVRCTNVKVTRLGPIFWLAEATYEGDNEFELNRPIIKKGNKTTSEPLDRDWFGAPIVNVQGEPVEGLSRDVSDTVITVTRNFEEINDDLVLDYLEATNSDVWYGYAPGRVRMTAYTAEQMFRNERDVDGYWRVTATMECRRGYGDTPPAAAWFKRWRNEGLYERVGPIVTIAAPDQTGGTQATAVATVINKKIATISVTNQGSGYTSAPTITISTSGHPGVTGAGATATAVVNNGRVRSINVGSQGDDYNFGLVRAVDDNNVAMTKPVLLKYDGTREYDANNAVFLFAQVYGSLPYNALGLL